MDSPLLSICIPTYNRGRFLNLCLESVIDSVQGNNNVEICVSNNASNDNTMDIIEKYKHIENFFYVSNECNLGIPKNFLKVTSMAKGKYVWLVGDDDIIVPGAVNRILECIINNETCDFFLFNSINLNKRTSLTKHNTIRNNVIIEYFWNSNLSGPIAFNRLISENITFDHLGGMYLSVFKRKTWLSSVNALDQKKISSPDKFSSHDNTFPHVRIFAKGFMSKNAFIMNIPIVYSFSDVREWGEFYPLIRTVRLLESLEIYKKFGLSSHDYKRIKNKTLIFFAEDILKICVLRKKYKGYDYINLFDLLIINVKFIGFWQSIVNLFFKVIKYSLRKYYGEKNDEYL